MFPVGKQVVTTQELWANQFWLLAGLIVIFSAGCGQIITLTPTPAPTATIAVVLAAATGQVQNKG